MTAIELCEDRMKEFEERFEKMKGAEKVFLKFKLHGEGANV